MNATLTTIEVMYTTDTGNTYPKFFTALSYMDALTEARIYATLLGYTIMDVTRF